MTEPRGDIAVVTTVPTELEAEMVCGLLRSAGIPCLHRRAATLGPAGTLAALGANAVGPGACEVIVPATAAADARRVLDAPA